MRTLAAPGWSRVDPGGLAALVAGLFLGGAMVAAGDAVYAIQGGVLAVADLLPVGYAFSAGMLAAVNPCGVLLLPSLVAYYLAGAGATAGPARFWYAARMGAAATAGFVVLFALVGTAVGAGGTALVRVFPAAGLVVGLALAATGAWLALTGRGLGIPAAGRAMGGVRLSGARSLFSFGVAYAVCSLSCTLPIFLVVAGSALATRGFAVALGQFVAYALGMGSVLTAVILGAAFFQGATTRWTRRVAPLVHRASAAFLLGAGVFVISYWGRNGGFPF